MYSGVRECIFVRKNPLLKDNILAKSSETLYILSNLCYSIQFIIIICEIIYEEGRCFDVQHW